MTMNELQTFMGQETGIPVDNQDVLLASGASPELHQLATHCWTAPVSGD